MFLEATHTPLTAKICSISIKVYLPKYLIFILINIDYIFWSTLTSETFFGNSKLFKNDEKCVPFHLKSSFCFEFLVMYQNGLIKKIRLISNFMTSRPG